MDNTKISKEEQLRNEVDALKRKVRELELFKNNHKPKQSKLWREKQALEKRVAELEAEAVQKILGDNIDIVTDNREGK